MIQEFFQARDGKKLSFRWLPCDESDLVLVCMHGSTFSSQWYLMFGRMVHRNGISVCLPDWRGHGKSEGDPGDLDYSDQLQDDLADLLKHLKKEGLRPLFLEGTARDHWLHLNICTYMAVKILQVFLRSHRL
ncbi:alpha/beta fold hydrolase [Microbulbifer sp. VAAF005]|uniref:alpha/beta hydrolase n=1 Tax=Microbulbifer sp. VAAF005 TaxID=3034230 RepID=UPI0024AD5472|nr:alpha/beta fold hydrolase [Microbulbifer sp. VAAF005]WHI47576.1 alpha/beta fold hydrolase [Microbulbifer sp. VAAF005]